MQQQQSQGAFIFLSYSHLDKTLKDRLEEHLSNLKYRRLITTWHDREIRAGQEWAQQIDISLDQAHIILLLISSHFMASEYCYSIEMKRALERHDHKEADVIPILLRPVHFKDAPFAKLQMLPRNGKPVAQWRDRDSAFLEIAFGIEEVALKYSVIPYPVGPWGQPTEISRRYLGPSLIVSVISIGLITAGIYVLSQHPNIIPYMFAFLLGLLLLIAGILIARKAIRTIREKIERRQAHRQRYYSEAIAAYDYALRHNPEDEYAYQGLGNALYALQHYNQALSAFLEATQIAPTSSTYVRLGNTYVALQRYSEAVAAYEKAIELDPSATFNYDNLLRSLLKLGRKREAAHIRAQIKQQGDKNDT